MGDQTDEVLDEQHQEQNTPTPPLITQETIVQSKQEQQGYSEPIWIDARDETGHTSSDLPKIAVQTKPVERTAKDVAFQRITATRPDKTEIDLTAMVLFDSKSWKQGKHHVLEGESPKGITPAKAIRNAGIEDDIRNSLAIFCIGLASTEYDPSQSEDNTVLSDNRAIRLCTALHELGYIERGSRLQKTIAVGLGERDQEDENKPTQIRQRVAVIIAANKLDDDDSYGEVIDIIRSSLDVVSVSLDRYERSEGAGFQMHIVTGSRFIEASDESWDFDDGLADRSVLENGDAPN